MPRPKLFDEKEVLERAMELFWKKGFHATSMQDLVDHIGINRASIYDTFGNKEALYKKSINHYQMDNLGRQVEFLANQPASAEGLLNYIKTTIDALLCDRDKKGCFIVNCLSEIEPVDSELTKLVVKKKKEFEKMMERFFSRAIKEKHLPLSADPKFLARLYFLMNAGMMTTSKHNRSRKDLEKMASRMALSLFTTV